jgi:hypothetical protein
LEKYGKLVEFSKRGKRERSTKAAIVPDEYLKYA